MQKKCRWRDRWRLSGGVDGGQRPEAEAGADMSWWAEIGKELAKDEEAERGRLIAERAAHRGTESEVGSASVARPRA